MATMVMESVGMPQLAGFGDLATDDLIAVDGGFNADRFFGGFGLFAAASLSLALAASGPVGLLAGGIYVAICAGSGAYTAYGIVS